MLRGLGTVPLVAVLLVGCGGTAVLLTYRHAPAPRSFTVRPVDLSAQAVLTGQLEPKVTWRLYFGAVTATIGAAKPAEGAGGSCDATAQTTRTGSGPGPVTTLRVAPGDRVSKGQLLAEADTATVAGELQAAETDLDQATALLAQDRSQAAATAAPAAEGDPSSPPVPVVQPPVGADLDRIQRDQDRTADLRRAVGAARITAPADGVVQEVDTAPGATPDCRTPALVLRSTALRAQVRAPAGIVARLHPGEPVRIALADANLHADTMVSDLPQTAAPVAGTAGSGSAGAVLFPVAAPFAPFAPTTAPSPAVPDYPLDLDLVALPPTALPGMAVTATVTLDRRPGVLAVPTASIRHDPDGTHVTLLRCPTDAHSCHGSRVTVVTGLTAGRLTQITTGLHDGDSIAVPEDG